MNSQSKPITSVSEFVDRISKIENEHKLFFRGHPDKSYKLIPGIYRFNGTKGSLIEFEDQIYRDTIAKAPNDFKGLNTLESLSKMQHYGVPTRLLDLTGNALVALYFACEKDFDKDGEVVMFEIPDNSIFNYDSDRVLILANLAKCKFNFKFDSYLIRKIEKVIDNVVLLRDENFESNFKTHFSNNLSSENYDKLYHLLYKELENIKLESRITILKKEIENFFENTGRAELYHGYRVGVNVLEQIKNNEIKSLNEKYLGDLVRQIREDKSHFLSIINPLDISKIMVVMPKQDNERIVRQKGAFIMFGMESFSSQSEIKPRVTKEPNWLTNNNKIVIKAKSKKPLLEELKNYGIDKAYIYPEIDKISEVVKNEYLEKLNAKT